MKLKFKMGLLLLLITSVAVQGYNLYVHATWKEGSGIPLQYIVEPLDYIPEDYWNLTDPDPYILEAIQNPGNWTEPFPCGESTFWSIAEWYADKIYPGWPRWVSVKSKPFFYNGTYYNYGLTYAGLWISVSPLNEPPEQYWNLTNPNKYILKAIENLGDYIPVGIEAESIIRRGTPRPFQYNGTYYTFSLTDIDYAYPPMKPPIFPKLGYTALALAGIWVAVGSIYILKGRKTKTEP